MTPTTNRLRIVRIARHAARLGVVVLAGVALAACPNLDIQNTNAPTSDALTGSPTRAVLARGATGVQIGIFNDLATELEFYSIYGREGYNLLGNDPRETNEQVKGPQDPSGRSGGSWLAKYQAIRTINTYLAALENQTGLTEAEVRASQGFAKTLKAYHFHRLAVRSGATGIPMDVDRPITAEPAPFVAFADAMAAVSALLDEAYADLQAGGAAFPFTFVPGWTGFTTPATFAQFNRGYAAKVLVHRATFNGCGACWGQAATALGQSFITEAGLPASLATGVYYGYTGAAGELGNPVTEGLAANRYFLNNSIISGAQTQPGGDPDLRLLAKAALAPAPRSLNDITATHKPVMYNVPGTLAADLGADVPLLINEELLLLRAEVRWNNGDKPGAIDDLNLVRQHAGGLAGTSLTAGSADADFVTELLYNRLYSLLWTQGTRWIDARRYGRTGALPQDRPGDLIHANMLVPAGECDARGLSVPCTP